MAATAMSNFVRTTLLLLWVSPLLILGSSLWETALYRFQLLLHDPDSLTFNVPTSEMRREYDFVVIGAGSGGSVVTNRLTEVPKWSVLLLEAGGDELALTDVPMMAPVLARTFYNWGYKTLKQDNACLGYMDGTCVWTRGKGMGGTSILNYLVYTRGHPKDYDLWESLGNQGWNWRTAMKYFLKSENAVYDDDLEHSPYHSTGGYLDVQKVPYHSPVARSFLEAAEEMGYPLVDYNAGAMMGFSRIQATLRNGSRCSANKAFLRPIRARPNLHVAKFAQVTKILINPETKRAYGVEFVRDGKRWFVKARKEVILSAGALNSPQLLMLSGIGPKKHLEYLKIPVIQDLPGVGLNLQDHVTLGVPFMVNDSVTVSAQGMMLSVKPTMDYIQHGTGPFTLAGGAEALGFIRTDVADTPLDYPDMEIVFAPGHIGSGEPEISRKVIGLSEETFNSMYRPLNTKDAFTLCPVITQPHSRGWIKLRDKNPLSPPLMYANYFSNEHDLETMTSGAQFAVRMVTESDSFKKYDATLSDFALSACRKHGFNTRDYWKCAVQQLTQSLGHQCCTAKMGPEDDPMAVVDPELKVYGIKGLRVVDASIMPRIPAGHTNGPIFMIGEKASDMIKKTYGK